MRKKLDIKSSSFSISRMCSPSTLWISWRQSSVWLPAQSSSTNSPEALPTSEQRFANPLPSFHPVDLLIGVAGGALLKLAVYIKGKNRKKFRQGEEYGSARWGRPEDIRPYMDDDFSNNVILTQTEGLTMNSRPKQPKYARNKNILVIGGSGSARPASS